MLDTYVWLHILSAFIVGGLWIATTTLIADRFGSKIGWFLWWLPSTSVLAFFFVSLIHSPAIVAHSTNTFPLIEWFTWLFVVIYVLLARKTGFWAAISIAFLVWFLLAGTIVLSWFNSFGWSLLLYGIILVGSYIILEKCFSIPSAKGISIKKTTSQFLRRAVFGGLVIAFAVFASKIWWVIFGVIFAAFPAMFSTTLIIWYFSRWLEFSLSLAKSLVVTGLITVVIYAMAVRYLYPPLWIYRGTLCSLVIILLVSYLTYIFVQKKLK